MNTITVGDTTFSIDEADRIPIGDAVLFIKKSIKEIQDWRTAAEVVGARTPLGLLLILQIPKK